MNIEEVMQQPGTKERALRDDILRSLHVAVPGEVISYNSTNRTVSVQPVIRDWGTRENPPILLDIPVFFPGNFTFTPQKGDGCLVVCADHCIDSWMQSGGVSTPMSSRTHSLSDGFAFVGFHQTGGTPMGGGGDAGAVIATYTVSNTSGSYSHTFADVRITEYMKPILFEIATSGVISGDVDVTTGDGEITIESASVAGTTDVTITLIGGPESLSPSQYELIMEKIGCLSVVDGKLCITYEGGTQ